MNTNVIVRYKWSVRIILKNGPRVLAPLVTGFGLMAFLARHGFDDAVIAAGAYMLSSAVLLFAALVLFAIYAAAVGVAGKTPLATSVGGLRGCRFVMRSQSKKASTKVKQWTDRVLSFDFG